MKCRELPERILREKPQKKTRLTHPQSLHRDSSNSSTLTLSIVISLRGSLPKPFLTIPTSMRRPFGAWEAVRKRPISYWLMLWFIVESGKLKKKQVQRNLVGVEAWRAQVTRQIRHGRSSAVHVSQIHSLVDYLLLGGRWRGFTPRASISSSMTHRVLSLCLHISSLNLCHLIFFMDVILFGLDCLSILY